MASRDEPSCPVSLRVSTRWAMDLLNRSMADARKLIDYMKGTLKVDEFITHTQTLGGINAGFDDMHVSQIHPQY